MNTISDEAVLRLAEHGQELSLRYLAQKADWKGSPFQWIHSVPSSRRRGKVGELLAASIFRDAALSVHDSVGDTDADILVAGKRVEVKFSTLWENGFYKFQQVRDQNYDFLFCLGISPFDAHAWVFPKSEVPFGELEHQHGGKRGTDTWWITVHPNSPPHWMQIQSGKVGEVSDTFRRYLET